MRKFLTAEWRDLVMANYEVSPDILRKWVPNHTEPDLHDGRCFVSLVAFKFLHTRVLGIPVPFHTDFEEVNLRFYVTHNTGTELRRGVVFVKEIVPRRAITFVAKTIYGEPYETWKMYHRQGAGDLEYGWRRGDSENLVRVSIGENTGVPPEGSHGRFIIEHYWGYTPRGAGRTDEYKVEHPEWQIFDITSSDIEVDFGNTYGAEFAFLTDADPFSVLMAKGSEISVYKGAKIRN